MFEKYVNQYLPADKAALQEIINDYGSLFLKWERFKQFTSNRQLGLKSIIEKAEQAIFAAYDNGGEVDIWRELETSLKEKREQLIKIHTRRQESNM